MAEHEVCNDTLLRQFGTYMITTAKTRLKNPFRRDSANDYYNSVVQTIRKIFPKNEFLMNSTFASEVRADILKLTGRRNIEDGIELTEQSKGVGRNVMKLIGKYFSHILVELPITASYSKYQLILRRSKTVEG